LVAGSSVPNVQCNTFSMGFNGDGTQGSSCYKVDGSFVCSSEQCTIQCANSSNATDINDNMGWLTCDACGMCGGDNTTCAGCDGVPYSNKTQDVCGVCGGDGTSCLSGCDHRPFSHLEFDVCGICGGNGTSCLSGCDHRPFSELQFDVCGVCGGNGMSCLGCDGVPFSNKTKDICNVCDGNGTSCLSGCDMQPWSTKVEDLCGVCGGSNACISGCDRKPYSTLTVDACGVCGGDNSTCAPKGPPQSTDNSDFFSVHSLLVKVLGSGLIIGVVVILAVVGGVVVFKYLERRKKGMQMKVLGHIVTYGFDEDEDAQGIGIAIENDNALPALHDNDDAL
jgi:hypothetical protein